MKSLLFACAALLPYCHASTIVSTIEIYDTPVLYEAQALQSSQADVYVSIYGDGPLHDVWLTWNGEGNPYGDAVRVVDPQSWWVSEDSVESVFIGSFAAGAELQLDLKQNPDFDYFQFSIECFGCPGVAPLSGSVPEPDSASLLVVAGLLIGGGIVGTRRRRLP